MTAEELHVDVQGDGPDVVLLHGWGMHGGVWGEFADMLAAICRVHRIDLPGHGYSAKASFRTLDDVTQAVVARVPRGAVLLGWSLGGLVALRLAQTEALHTPCVVLLAATPCFVQRKDWSHGMPVEQFDAFETQLAADPVAMLQRFVALSSLGARAPRAVARALRQRLAERPIANAGVLASGLEILRDADLRAEVPRMNVPLVTIHGAGDAVVPVGAARWLSRTVPSALGHVICGEGHAAFLSHADTMARVVLETAMGNVHHA